MRNRWPIALVALAALVRIPTLGSQSFWRDEVITVNLLHKSFGGMLSGVVDLESTPPLYYAIAWVWARIFGFGEAGLRSLSVVFGALTVAVVYRAAEAAISRRAAIVAGLLATVNPFLVWYSQEARSYALFILLTSCSLLWFVRALQEPSRRNLALWSLTSALALGAHYFAAFLIAAEALWLLATLPRRRRDVVLWSVPWVAVGLLLAPLAHAQSDHASWISESGSLPARLKESVKNFVVGNDPPWQPWAVLVAGAVVALALYFFTRERGRSAPAARAAGVAGLVALIVTALADAAGLHYVNGRNVSIDFIALTLPVAAGIALARSRVRVVLTSALVALSAAIVVNVWLDPAYQKENWRLAFQMLGPSEVPRGLGMQRGMTRELLAL
jgi:uncharacterized membrane protein